MDGFASLEEVAHLTITIGLNAPTVFTGRKVILWIIFAAIAGGGSDFTAGIVSPGAD